MRNTAAIAAALSLSIGFAAGGYFAGDGLVRARAVDRSVTVKGLAEREVPANIAIWPLKFVAADQSLAAVHDKLGRDAALVTDFLSRHGFGPDEVTTGAPAVADKQAARFGDAQVGLRFTASQTVTVYTNKVDAVRTAMQSAVELGRQGVVMSSEDYEARPEFLFTGLNDLKPTMIEEATVNARQVAEKFAADSDSRIGKIRNASQGQFSIDARDSSTPHIKRVRVVSTIEYYLVD